MDAVFEALLAKDPIVKYGHDVTTELRRLGYGRHDAAMLLHDYNKLYNRMRIDRFEPTFVARFLNDADTTNQGRNKVW